MNALQSFLERGPERRAALENALAYYIPPELRGWLGLANELNPVVSMERAGGSARAVADPNVQGWDKVAAVGDTVSNMANALAPVVLGSSGAVPAANAVEEALMGFSAANPMAFAARDFATDEFGGVGFGDEVASRGAQIMDMLRAGRGAEVTDDMLDMGDPAANARLNEWLFNNYDLPMDAASRAARKAEMGFEADLMHGTDATFPAFRLGDGSNTGVSAPAVFLTDSRNVARSYGDNVMDVTARIEQPLAFDFGGRSTTYFDGAIRTPSDLAKRVSEIAQDVRGNALDPESDLVYDLQDVGFDYLWNTDIDAAEMRNVVDSAGSIFGGDVANNVAIFDPRNIRLRSARFDPRLAHLRNLSAGIGAPVLMSDMFQQEEEEPRNALSGFLSERGL